MPYTLIITEKPNAAKRIADALSDKIPKKSGVKGVPYYEFTRNGSPFIAASAVGHLFGLAEVSKSKGFSYPVFDIHWAPTYETSKTAGFSKKYLDNLKRLGKKAEGFIVATDFDIEGEVIGLNVLRYACLQKDAKRMKFSTLTKPDLEESFDKMNKTLEWGQANAGEARHKLDWYYGINLSRALSSAIKKAGMFKILSSGRVQAPALNILVEREKEIQAFKPEPYWQVELNGKADQQKLNGMHKTEKFWKLEEADAVITNTKGHKEGTVAASQKTQQKQLPPHPFDLTTLQTESYRVHRIPPNQTLEIAQRLYTSGLTSYPRTSSQQLPETIGYKKIMSTLQKQPAYAELSKELLKGPMKPRNGKKTDPAHPAIYPTGIVPETLEGRDAKVYDLIVRRFLSTFGTHAVRETATITIAVNKEPFIVKGTRTVEQGWYKYYGPYVKLEEQELPALNEGDKVSVTSIKRLDKETQPPKRYTESSIIKELERRNLGTKATRGQIIATLEDRNYITGQPLEVTELGMQIISILDSNCNEIISEELTRHFEEELEGIRGGKRSQDVVLEDAKKVLIKILDDFKKKEKKIGESLAKTFKETRSTLTTVGPCQKCSEGMLVIRKGRFGRFIACDKYPDCKTTISLPATGSVKPCEKLCETCKYPKVLMIRRAKKPQEVCLNQECASKQAEDLPKTVEGEGKECPKCGKGKMVLKKSIYGQFLACDKYPKCKTTEKI